MIPSLKARQAKQVWVGIDPGMAGAIAAIDESSGFLWAVDMPITREGRAGEFDLDALAEIVCEVAHYPNPRVCLEWPQTRPDEAPESSKRFGVGLGVLEGMFTFIGTPPLRVAPNKWKGRLGLSGKSIDPLASRQESVSLAESVIVGLPWNALRGIRGGLKDGRAEALLVAWESLTSTTTGLAALPYDMRLARVMFGAGRRRKRVSGGGF